MGSLKTALHEKDWAQVALPLLSIGPYRYYRYSGQSGLERQVFSQRLVDMRR